MEHAGHSTNIYRFIVFNMITGTSLAHSDDARSAIEATIKGQRLPDTDFLECLDCRGGGRKIWDLDVPLFKARERNHTVFRGPGYKDNWAPVTMAEGA